MKGQVQVVFTKQEQVNDGGVSLLYTVRVASVTDVGTEYSGMSDTYIYEESVSYVGDDVYRHKGIVDATQDWEAQKFGLEQWDRLAERSGEFSAKWVRDRESSESGNVYIASNW